MRLRLIVLLAVVAIVVGVAVWRIRRPRLPDAPADAKTGTAPAAAAHAPNRNATKIYAHNLRLHQGPKFAVYVRWLRGEMVRSKAKVDPSFDDPESFFMDLTNGVLRANLGDISNYLNTAAPNTPLKNIVVTGNGSEIDIKGTLHKLVSLPVELKGIISAAPNSRVHMHVTKINVLKIPFKAMLGSFDVHVSDFFHSGQIPGIEVSGNDIFFDPQILLPPPHIRGSLTAVTVENPDLQAVYGNVQQDLEKSEQWRNFLRLRDGALNFGRLTMNPVDLVMIDISQDAWFDLDLAQYQAQLVNGYTRMTPQAGLQIFMPDVSNLPRQANQDISIEWLKNRNIAPPQTVTSRSGGSAGTK